MPVLSGWHLAIGFDQKSAVHFPLPSFRPRRCPKKRHGARGIRWVRAPGASPSLGKRRRRRLRRCLRCAAWNGLMASGGRFVPGPLKNGLAPRNLRVPSKKRGHTSGPDVPFFDRFAVHIKYQQSCAFGPTCPMDTVWPSASPYRPYRAMRRPSLNHTWPVAAASTGWEPIPNTM